MPYDATLAGRLRDALAARHGIEEKKMFGGVGFLLNGNMLVGVWKESLIVRLGPQAYEKALREPCVRPFAITGRPMKGWVMVDPEGIEDDRPLNDYVERAVLFVQTLPKK